MSRLCQRVVQQRKVGKERGAASRIGRLMGRGWWGETPSSHPGLDGVSPHPKGSDAGVRLGHQRARRRVQQAAEKSVMKL
jgi:hypothetical protein